MNKNNLFSNFLNSMSEWHMMTADVRSIAVAVSGGADSMALALLLHDWCQEKNICLMALSVDHGLRKEAKGETKQVQSWLEKRNIPTNILTIEGLNKDASIQERARLSRYQILKQACDDLGVQNLFVAHHASDQVETILQRLVSGSGPDGLKGMGLVSSYDGIKIVRPLLGTDKKTLVDFLQDQNQEWIEDPSNENEQFTRVRLRKTAKYLMEEGLSPDRLQRHEKRMNRMFKALDQVVDQMEQSIVRFEKEGYALFNVQSFLAMPIEIAIRLLDRLLRWVTGDYEQYGRLERLENLYDAMVEDSFSGKTFFGAVIKKQSNDFVVAREASAVNRPSFVIGDHKIVWDGRIVIEGAKGCLVRPYQDKDAAILKQSDSHLLDQIPSFVRYGLPVIEKERLVAPLFGVRDKEVTMHLVYDKKNKEYANL